MKLMIGKIKNCMIAASNIFPAYNARTPYYDGKHHVFIFKGSYRQIGKQYVTAIPMANNLRKVRRYLNRLDHGSRQKLNIEIDKAKHFLEERFSGMLELMKGVCDAYPLFDLDEVVLLNYCTVLMNWQVFSSCSSIAFLVNGKPVIGQNLDLGRGRGYAAAYIIPEDGNALFVHVNPGFLWFSAGVNEFGLCITGSSVNVEARNIIDGDQFPQEMLDFYLLSQTREADDAYKRLRSLPKQGPLQGGSSLILADKGGRVKNAEVAGDIISLSESDMLVWVTTNHFRISRLVRMNRRSDKISIRLEENSVARYQEAITWSSGNILKTDSLRVFLRRKGYAGAWWRTALYPDLGRTAASYIIDFNAGNFEYWVESQKKYCSVSLSCLYGRSPILW